MYLSCPPHVAKDFSREMQKLLGYKQAGYALGYFADTLGPAASWSEGFDVTVPGSFRKKAPSARETPWESVSAKAKAISGGASKL